MIQVQLKNWINNLITKANQALGLKNDLHDAKKRKQDVLDELIQAIDFLKSSKEKLEEYRDRLHEQLDEM